jgi:hypothetical protein
MASPVRILGRTTKLSSAGRFKNLDRAENQRCGQRLLE